MATPFTTLLDATLAHLEALRDAGERFVTVDPKLLTAACQPLQRCSPPRPRPAGAPGSSAPSVSQAPSFAGASPPPSTRRSLAAVAVSRDAPGQPTSQPGGADRPPSSTAAAVGGSTIDRAAAMAEVRERALVCQKCPHLVRSRTQVVFGVGSLAAEIMFVGEAPGADEDRLGEPFVGRAGQLLTRIITAMGLTRDTVYIANLLKCRPDLPPGARGNRAPRPEEIDTCKPYLLNQIEILRPRVIVALGATAVQGLLGLKVPMNSVRGRWQEFRGIPVMPTFHPSYLLRAEDSPDRGNAEKRKTWEDLLLVLGLLGHPITERMQNYFLKRPDSSAS